jgi:protein tyrosine phosphatase (PTP) superfamily phosphohydrolase (DUF442 family)
MTGRIKILSLMATILVLAGCGSTSTPGQEADEMTHSGPAMNFHRISPSLATGGHFTGDGVSALKDQGVSLVIDLRDKPPEDQQQRLQAAGIRYINVPVVWKAPQAEDFATFARYMAENQGEHIFVQCQANYRASAMTYAYRVAKDDVPETEARKDLEAIWTPEGTWETYIDEILESSDPGNTQY